MSKGIEVRTSAARFEVRAAADGAADVRTLAGHAAVFGNETVIMDTWREVIEPGAFDDVLGDDCVFLMDHEGAPMARTTGDTLRLSVDDRGLAFEADLATAEPDACGLISKIERRTISQMSFGFVADLDGGVVWTRGENGMLPLRSIRKVSRLFDVSAVTWPAYDATGVSVRGQDVTKAERAAVMAEMGRHLGVSAAEIRAMDADAARLRAGLGLAAARG